MATVGRNIAAPLLFLNLVMYFIVLGFASWCLNRYINGQTHHLSFGGNSATGFFLTFAILAAVIGIVSKFAGGNHIRAWRNDSLAAAGSSSLVAWAVTVLAFGKTISTYVFVYLDKSLCILGIEKNCDKAQKR
ncbi:Membrane protein PM19L [Camellia lanceoleosa]|uniref:Membrane protein PM19L n=1 Tax=Camellia lanceoleosa TaxID=1840588 RepID=A0ACC0H8I1_9ERIC|nr:Membrane protein PM19L [Camellia lanceoleosa]